MTENTVTLVDVSPPRSGERPVELPALPPAEQDAVRELVRQARGQRRVVDGAGWLLKQPTKMVVEVAFDDEMSKHMFAHSGLFKTAYVVQRYLVPRV